jgi:hypothetical protein
MTMEEVEMAVGESTKMGLAYITESVRLLYNQEIKIENDGNTFTVMIPLVQ